MQTTKTILKGDKYMHCLLIVTNYLTFDGSVADELTYVLYTVEGEVVWSENGFGTHTIQTAELNNGIYFYKVLQNGEILHQGK